MKWQPIETAPTDGTRILLRGRNGKIADGHYGQPDGFANPKRFVWPYINATPTHWAPLALIAAAAELLAAAQESATAAPAHADSETLSSPLAVRAAMPTDSFLEMAHDWPSDDQRPPRPSIRRGFYLSLEY